MDLWWQKPIFNVSMEGWSIKNGGSVADVTGWDAIFHPSKLVIHGWGIHAQPYQILYAINIFTCCRQDIKEIFWYGQLSANVYLWYIQYKDLVRISNYIKKPSFLKERGWLFIFIVKCNPTFQEHCKQLEEHDEHSLTSVTRNFHMHDSVWFSDSQLKSHSWCEIFF